jgi:hypothetical protein
MESDKTQGSIPEQKELTPTKENPEEEQEVLEDQHEEEHHEEQEEVKY